ncbi:50S ribosomal protein L6 [Candidatus Mycoplasma haematominutum]|uniref:50S ribosomal protein L6 n=1 Tax=Candidatus Mycoplasma haematominutum 'Birmingham 1' TaxID=1116213 RepID=G8C330_9MOLU|nr:50S ribosomal protein L6 [Candidatus Mycoplasma haematominutum]CCE66728.1 ribosomal protein L6 [Candidatus Mycoplasma haematominutum 'Birmingham 1']
MSRIGNRSLTVPEGLEFELTENYLLFKKGEKSRKIMYDSKIVKVRYENEILSFERGNNSKFSNMMQGTLNSLCYGAIIGLTRGFQKKLIIEGVGYKALQRGDKLHLSLGYSREKILQVPGELQLSIPSSGKEILLSSHNKEILGEFAALVKKQRPVEPYKGKGIRIEGEIVVRKQGKSAEGAKK